MKKKLPTLTPEHRAFNKLTAQAEDETAKYVIPLYAIDEDKERYALGSAVLLEIAGKKFLISAAHVFDENSNSKNPSDIEVPGRHTFIPIRGEVVKSPLPSSGQRIDDIFDIGVVELPEDIATQLDHHKFLDISQVDPSERPYSRSLYTFSGYPSSKQEIPEQGGTLTLEPVRYTGVPLPPTKYPPGYMLGTHHGIDYHKKRMVARSGKLELPPDPYGVSGGGLFRLGTFEEIKKEEATPTLIGIAISIKPGCLIATNCTYALELIRARNPELDEYIPRSTYFRISVTA